MVYLDEECEYEGMSDKNKISLFDESKCEDGTIEHKIHGCD